MATHLSSSINPLYFAELCPWHATFVAIIVMVSKSWVYTAHLHIMVKTMVEYKTSSVCSHRLSTHIAKSEARGEAVFWATVNPAPAPCLQGQSGQSGDNYNITKEF